METKTLRTVAQIRKTVRETFKARQLKAILDKLPDPKLASHETIRRSPGQIAAKQKRTDRRLQRQAMQRTTDSLVHVFTAVV